MGVVSVCEKTICCCLIVVTQAYARACIPINTEGKGAQRHPISSPSHYYRTQASHLTAVGASSQTMLQINLCEDPTIVTTTTHSYATVTIPASSVPSLVNHSVFIKLDENGSYEVCPPLFAARTDQAHITTRKSNASLTGTLNMILRSGVSVSILSVNTTMGA
jgi:hypothetical protein